MRNMIVKYALKPSEAGTEFTFATDFEMPWGVFGKLIQPFAKREAKKIIEREKKIKF